MNDIAARHKPNGETRSFEPERCITDNDVWPCDAELLRRERDEAMDRMEQMTKDTTEAYAARHVAEADAQALAEEMREAIEVVHQTGGLRDHVDTTQRKGWVRGPIETCVDSVCVEGLALLAAHDARVSHIHSDSATDDDIEAKTVAFPLRERHADASKHPPGTVATVAHTTPFDNVKDEGGRP